MGKKSLVIWGDAHSTRDELNMDELRARHKASLVHTYGEVLISDERGITITGERLPTGNSTDDTFRNSTFIPRGMVVSEGVVKRAKKTKAGPVDSTIRGDTQEAEGSLRDVPPATNG